MSVDLPTIVEFAPLTLDELRCALGHAETELACADMIDNQARRVAETERCRRRRDDIKAQITRIEEAL